MSKTVKGDIEIDGTVYAYDIQTIKPLPTGEDSTIIFFGTDSAAIPAAEVGYARFDGPIDAVETETQRPLPYSGTLRNMYVHVSSNGLDGVMVITARRGAVDTPLSLVINASATGVFADTVNTQGFNAGDLLSVEIDTTAATVGTATAKISMEYVKGPGVA